MVNAALRVNPQAALRVKPGAVSHVNSESACAPLDYGRKARRRSNGGTRRLGLRALKPLAPTRRYN